MGACRHVAAVSIQSCSSGKCLVAERDFEVGEVVLEETPFLEMLDDQVLKFQAAGNRYEAVWLYAQQHKEQVEALLSLSLSEGAASSDKVHEVKQALLEVSPSDYEMALRFLVRVNGPTTALFETISRANHSCAPNVRMIGDGWPARLVAVRSIKKQDEVLLCYGGWETPFLTSARMQRREHLQKHWGFHCRCPRCEDEAEEHHR